MKITINKKELVKYLLNLSSLVKGNLQLPILSMVLWEVEKEKLTLRGTDLNCGIIYKIDTKTEGEGVFLISPVNLLEYINTLGEGNIEIEIEGEKMRVHQGESRATLSIAKMEDFPDMHKPTQGEGFKADIEIIRNIIKRIGVSVAMDGTRPVLAGVLLKREDGYLTFVGTDGYRLCLEKIKISEGPDFSLLISLKSLNNILRAFETGDIDFQIDNKNKRVWLRQEGTLTFARQIEGSFPDFHKIIPQNFSTKLSIERGDLQLAVSQTAVFARQNANIVKIEIGKKIKFLTQSSYLGSSEIEIEGKKEGEDCSIAFNYRYLKEALGIFEEGDVCFELNGPLAPTRIVGSNNPNFFHIIMPVKL